MKLYNKRKYLGKTRHQNIYRYSTHKGKEKFRVYYRTFDAKTGANTAQRTKTFNSYDKAHEFMINVNSDIRNQRYIDPNKVSLAEFLRTWLDGKYDIRHNTRRGYRVNIESHIIPHIGNIQMQRLNAYHIKKLYNKLQKDGRADGKAGGLSSKSILYVHRVLKQALKEAVNEDVIMKNVAERVIPPRVHKYDAKRYTLEQIKELIEVSKNTYMQLPIALAGLYGLRRGEILGLQWKDIDFKNEYIRVRKQIVDTEEGVSLEKLKTDSSQRDIPVNKYIIDLLKKHRKHQLKIKLKKGAKYNDNDLVVCKIDGDCYDPSYFSRKFNEHLHNTGFEHIRFHDLRHSAASYMLENKVDIIHISKILGHSNTNITSNLYARPSEKSMENIRDIIDNALKNTNTNI